eukprot:6088585-Amphidinium_carterae.1
MEEEVMIKEMTHCDVEKREIFVYVDQTTPDSARVVLEGPVEINRLREQAAGSLLHSGLVRHARALHVLQRL